MTMGYLSRLICLCFASFFVLHFIAGMSVIWLSRRVIGASAEMSPRRSAGFLLTLRLVPACSSAFAVAALCIPSYLQYEEHRSAERVGALCMTLCICGLVICGVSIGRGLCALVRSVLVARRCSSIVHLRSFAAGRDSTLHLTEEQMGEAPFLALLGILRPKVLISQRVLDLLSAEQLEAALSHERAHHVSRDNLKRLLMVLAPDVFPFVNGFANVEHHWKRSIELAADDEAASRRNGSSVALAEALVRIAGLGNPARTIQLASPLSACNEELALRVRRLLTPSPVAAQAGSRVAVPESPSICGFSRCGFWVFCFLPGVLALLLLPSSALYPLHRLLELLLQ